MPLLQRVALLLNLGKGQEHVIELLPVLGIATICDIAEAVNMTTQEFAERWNDLPLEDTVIAGRLGISRQQVINLRKSARERLIRRVKDF